MSRLMLFGGAIVIALGVVGLVVAVVASKAPRPPYTPAPLSITGLLRGSANYDGKDVMVKGVVASGVGVLGLGAYQIRDPATGQEILVGTDTSVPEAGQVVTVHGVYLQAVSVGLRRYAIIIPGGWCQAMKARAALVPLPASLCAEQGT